jgi:hypothetical protein
MKSKIINIGAYTLAVVLIALSLYAAVSSTDDVNMRSAARTGFQGYGVLADLDGGYLAEVDSNGAVLINQNNNASDAQMVHGVAADGALISTGAKLATITVTGTGAGDWVAFYDTNAAKSATSGNAKLDVKVGTAADSKHLVFPKGISFTNEVYVDVVDADVGVYVTYET